MNILQPPPPPPTFETVLRGMRPQTLSSGTDSWKISEKKFKIFKA